MGKTNADNQQPFTEGEHLRNIQPLTNIHLVSVFLMPKKKKSIKKADIRLEDSEELEHVVSDTFSSM